MTFDSSEGPSGPVAPPHTPAIANMTTISHTVSLSIKNIGGYDNVAPNRLKRQSLRRSIFLDIRTHSGIDSTNGPM